MRRGFLIAISLMVGFVLLMQVSGLTASKPKKIVIQTENGISGKIILLVGDLEQLKIVTSPENASTGKITWKSSKSSVVNVMSNGLATAKKAGTATITATSKNGKKTGRMTITVVDPTIPTRIELNESGTKILNFGETLSLDATIYPETAESSILWSTSNKKIASISSNGVVFPNAEGLATITAKAIRGGATAKVKVLVINPYKPQRIVLDQIGTIKLDRNEKLFVKYFLNPENAISEIRWSSSNKKIATVLNDGTVVAKSKGVAKITASTVVGGKKASFYVNVSNKQFTTPSPSPTPSPTPTPTLIPTPTPTPEVFQITRITIDGIDYVDESSDGIFWRVRTKNGIGKIEYTYKLYYNGKLMIVSSSNDSYCFCKPKEPGDYFITVNAIDSTGASAFGTGGIVNVRRLPLTATINFHTLEYTEKSVDLMFGVWVGCGVPPYTTNLEIWCGETLCMADSSFQRGVYTHSFALDEVGQYKIVFTATDSDGTIAKAEDTFTIE